MKKFLEILITVLVCLIIAGVIGLAVYVIIEPFISFPAGIALKIMQPLIGLGLLTAISGGFLSCFYPDESEK